jgi:hypothetical protein
MEAIAQLKLQGIVGRLVYLDRRHRLIADDAFQNSKHPLLVKPSDAWIPDRRGHRYKVKYPGLSMLVRSGREVIP